MSPPRHDAPPRAWQSLGLAAPRTGAARPVLAPSAARRVRDNNSTVHATRGKSGADLPGVHKGVAHGGRFVPLQELLDLSWQAAIHLGRSACLLLVGRTQGSRSMFGATPALE